MPTIGELRQMQANREYAKKVALVAVLRERIQFQLQKWSRTTDEDKKAWYEELYRCDEGFPEEAKNEYDKIRLLCERTAVEIPEIDFSSGVPPSIARRQLEFPSH